MSLTNNKTAFKLSCSNISQNTITPKPGVRLDAVPNNNARRNWRCFRCMYNMNCKTFSMKLKFYLSISLGRWSSSLSWLFCRGFAFCSGLGELRSHAFAPTKKLNRSKNEQRPQASFLFARSSQMLPYEKFTLRVIEVQSQWTNWVKRRKNC